jgi:cobalt-zinc-cadmium efflux system outer membrane protein
VQRITLERIGSRVHWTQGSDERVAASEAIRQILSRELTADDAVQLALLRNRNLQATFEELGLARADVWRAGLLRNPVLDAEIRFPSSGGGVGMELAFVQDFIDSLLLPLRRKLAEAAFEATKLRVAGTVLDLAGDVRSAFYVLQGAEQTLEMREQVLLATEASSDLATRLNRAGNITDLDLSNELALYEQSKLDVAAAEAEKLRARERLNALMGLWGNDTAWRIAHRLPELPKEEMALDGLEKQAVERSLDLGAAKREIESSARRLGLSGPLSVISEAGLGATGERESEGSWAVGPAVSVPVPLFNLGQASVAQARALLRQSEERFAALAVEIRSRVRAARNDVLAARNRAEHYRKVVLPLRERIVQDTQEQYNAMQVGAFQLLIAKQQEIDAGNRYIETVRDYWLARTELEVILSGTLPRSERPGGAGTVSWGENMAEGQGGQRD